MRILYFDLETKMSAEEVGGWNNIEDMGMSVGILWDTKDEQFHVYLEDQVAEMIQHLKQAGLIVGFNHIGFDYKVVAGARHVKGDQRQKLYAELAQLHNLDMLVELKKILGHRLKLDSLARPTLGAGKSADGLQALVWYKEGKLDKIIEYCKDDVKVTRDLHQYALKNNELLYDSNSGVKTVKVSWPLVQPKKEIQQMSLF